MNYLNIFIIFLIAVYILQGVYRGFLISLGNTAGMVISWGLGFLFGPILSRAISGGSFYTFLLNFTEGSARLYDPNAGNLMVSDLSALQVHDIVQKSQGGLPMPFASLIESNLNGQVFAPNGYMDVGDYFDYTVADVAVNIISFLIIYLIARIVIGLLINTVNFASPLPVLKRLDWLAGGALGAVRGWFDMFTLAMIVPVILISMPVNIPLFSDIINNSSLASYFYHNNFLLGFISGVIP